MNAAMCISVAASATKRGSAEAMARWRKEPVRVGAETMPATFLKHTDDQTVLALRTVMDVLEQKGWQDRSFTDWGVIAAPNFFGRASIAQSIYRFKQEGAWGVSPHLIPHQSLHAMSGTISQALKIHGPNFGVGGGPNAGPDAFLLAAAMLFDGGLPGLWLVLTGYEEEWIPASDRSAPAPLCLAVVLALTRADESGDGVRLTVGQASPCTNKDLSLDLLPDFQIGLLADELSARPAFPSGKWRLAESHCVEIDAMLPEAGDQ